MLIGKKIKFADREIKADGKTYTRQGVYIFYGKLEDETMMAIYKDNNRNWYKVIIKITKTENCEMKEGKIIEVIDRGHENVKTRIS